MEISITGVLATEGMLRRMSLLNTIVREWFESGEHDAIMRESFTKNFESGGRPAWEPLSQETVDSREKMGFSGSEPILVRTGNFMDEITSMNSEKSYRPGESIASWGIDQLRESEKGKFVAHMTGKTEGPTTIPMRPMIGFQDEDKEALTNSLSSFIERNFV